MKFYETIKDHISAGLQEQTVVFNTNSGVYYSLNEVGAYVWGVLEEKPYSADELVDLVVSDFDIDRQTAEHDILRLIEDLERENLIVSVTERDKEAV